MDRRKFLKLSGIIAACAGAGAAGAAVVQNATQDPAETIREIFRRKVLERWDGSKGTELAGRIEAESRTTFVQLPYVGAEEDNRWMAYLPPASFALAAYRVLVPGELPLEEFSGMFFESVREQTRNVSSLAMRVIGTEEGMKENTRVLAERSQQRRYPEDWVMRFVEGDGDFSYGVDVTECAIKKYLDRQGAPELTKYLCLTDYLTSEAVGRGLVRYKTLAEGCDCCDFRYRRGRESYLYPLRNGWPPQFCPPAG